MADDTVEKALNILMHAEGDKTECLVLSVAEAGRLLNVSRQTAYTAVRNGQIPAIRLGRRLLVPKLALKQLLENIVIERVAVVEHETLEVRPIRKIHTEHTKVISIPVREGAIPCVPCYKGSHVSSHTSLDKRAYQLSLACRDSILHLGLGFRLERLLARNGFQHISQVRQATDGELLFIRGVNLGSCNAIRSALGDWDGGNHSRQKTSAGEEVQDAIRDPMSVS